MNCALPQAVYVAARKSRLPSLTWSQIVNALAMLGEYPLIRYYKPVNKPIGVGAAYNEHITRRLAEMVQAEMDDYCKNNPDFPVTAALIHRKRQHPDARLLAKT